ncbi:MAG: Lrp/AsnC ligand binding domain-containing protein, partial [Verrucomicrobiota bacterium]|nr:Lrp/AsnC ligand binding domain-containing protein [Verrucomicrobiota bacterium]MDD8050273.1 Lrp/AsnC ligand binding domain-containing protein [Verrucomicrobiota bacterium]
MVTAVVLIQAERALLEETAEALAALKGVSEVYTVSGEWDIVAMVRCKSNEAVADVVAGKMLQIPGINRTKTLVAFRSFTEL